MLFGTAIAWGNEHTDPLTDLLSTIFDEQMTERIQDTPQKASFSKLLFELTISIFLPTLILKKMSGVELLGPVWSLVAALALPLGYGLYQFYRVKKPGFVPVLGFIGILLTGGIGLLKLDPQFIAIKEAAIPLIIGLATVISLKTPYPLVKTFLYSNQFMHVKKVDDALREKGNTEKFEVALRNSTFILASSFLLSSILNYVLAKVIVTSPAGTAEFNDQLGTMNLLSYPVIVIPCVIIMIIAMMYLFSHIHKMTGLTIEEILHETK